MWVVGPSHNAFSRTDQRRRVATIVKDAEIKGLKVDFALTTTLLWSYSDVLYVFK